MYACPILLIIEAGVARFRPILLTSVTTIAGLLPMMLERSMQAAFLQPIVISLAFGVLLAFFVTLLMVPALYGIGLDIANTRQLLMTRIRGWVSKRNCARKINYYWPKPDRGQENN